MMCSIVKVQGERGGGGKMRQIFPAPKRGQKSNGRGVQLRVPLSSVHRVSPSPLQYIYAVVPDRVAPGERPFPAPPRAQPETQKRCRVQRTQHRLNESERNTIGPTFPIFP